jgi:HD-GYP domain-containing protein (c-di-GMP phosphodiesterase class II)
MAPTSKVRLAELVGALTLATDLASGLPLEHGLRRTLLAIWIGAESGLDEHQLRDVYYVALLGSLGCVLDSAALAPFVDDDIAFRAAMFPLDMANPLVAMRYFGRAVGRGESPIRRAANLIGLATKSVAICRDVALRVGGMLDLGPQVKEALGQCDEHWNGKGAVLGLKAEQISIAARLFRLGQDIDVFYRANGAAAAVAMARERSGSYYDPQLVTSFTARADEMLGGLQVASAWDAVLAAEPARPRLLEADEFDALALQIANLIDMRSAYTVGHSPAVATLAEAAALRLGLPPHDARILRSAGLLHDLGRAGVPVALWDKRSPLTPDERDRLRHHPALTEIILAHSTSLGGLATVAGLHHERLDGSGYRGVTGSSMPVTARILAVADLYQSKLEPRSYRPAMTAEQAATEVRGQVAAGRLDADVAATVIDVAGGSDPPAREALPAGLTARELDVFLLLVRGMSNREIADALVLSPKTVGRHVERIYAKIDVSTRVGATLFAIEHGLAGTVPGPIRH